MVTLPLASTIERDHFITVVYIVLGTNPSYAIFRYILSACCFVNVYYMSVEESLS